MTIGNSVTSIGYYAFSSCNNLRTVVNNSNLDIVKGSSNYGYVGYHAYRILSGENINGYYFEENNGEYTLTGYLGDETNLVLPENYKGNTYSISYNAFRGCSGLTSIEIPNSVISIDGYAFADCSGLTSIEIPNSVTSIGNYAFYGCSLKSLTIGAGVLSIGSDQCKPVKTIWLTNTPPSEYENLQGNINYVANDQYSGLSNVRVYPYLSSAFETDGVKYVPVSPAERTCDAIDCSYDSDVVYINIGKTVSFKGVEMKVQNVMPYTAHEHKFVKGIKVSSKGDIGDNAFYGCTGITDATISNEGNIGESAFEGAMTSGNAVLKVSNKGNISNKAFYGCTGITDATISNEGNIGEWAFYGCTALETLTLGENVTSIGGSAFSGCSKLLVVTIPNKTNSLGSYSFASCSSMKTLKIGDGIVTIPEYAFNGCSSLSSVEWGKSVEKIERYSFYGCSALPSIDIPASVTSVGDYTFKGCTSIADVVIKDRTTDLSLGSNGSSPLFADCPLDSVYIGGNISYQTSNSYGYSPFYRNTSLRSVVITDKEEEISDNEFYGCTNLKNVSIGNNVKKIGNWAFSGCSNLDYFSFGKSVESIGEEAFSDCVNMTQLISHAVTPPTCGTQALDDINKWNCTLKIPEGTNSAYMAANQWKEFFFMENIPAAINGVVMDGEDADKDAPVYNMHGVRMQNADNLPAGIYIKNGKKYLVR